MHIKYYNFRTPSCQSMLLHHQTVLVLGKKHLEVEMTVSHWEKYMIEERTKRLLFWLQKKSWCLISVLFNKYNQKENFFLKHKKFRHSHTLPLVYHFSWPSHGWFLQQSPVQPEMQKLNSNLTCTEESEQYQMPS